MKCPICGTEFPAIHERHYVSRNTTKSGIVAAFGPTNEPDLFDSFDCPNCGCQVIAQGRKREFEPDEPFTDEEMLDEIGSEAIAEYLGLSEKQMNTILEAKDEGVKVHVGKEGKRK